MTLLDTIREWLGRQRRALHLSSPERVAHAADVLEANGRLAEASVLLAEGARKFSQAAALKAQGERVERRRLRERTAELTRALRARPDPALTLELVRIYRQTDDSVSARRVAGEAAKEFPKYAPLHQALGELWREIFEYSGMPHDGAAALRCLERCVELDQANIQARESLVVLYGRIGAWHRLLRHAAALLAVLRPGSVGRLASEALARMKLPDEDVDTLLRRFSRAKEEAALAGPARVGGENLTRILDIFQDLKGCRVAALVTVDNLLQEAPGFERVDKQALVKSVNGLRSAAGECCSRTGIGGFVMAQIETPDAAAYLKALSQQGPQAAGAGRAATLFLLTGSAARRREVLARLAHV